MHIATIFFPLIAPLVALIIFQKSPFVKAHAMRSLKETIVIQVLVFVAAIVSLSYTIVSLWRHCQENWQHFSLIPILVKFIVVWAALGLLEVFNTISALRAAHRASRGEWPKTH